VTSSHTYIGECCREWPMAFGYPVGRCGICREAPTYKRADERCSCADCTDNDDLDYPWTDEFWDALERDMLDPVFRQNFLAALDAIRRD